MRFVRYRKPLALELVGVFQFSLHEIQEVGNVEDMDFEEVKLSILSS